VNVTSRIIYAHSDADRLQAHSNANRAVATLNFEEGIRTIPPSTAPTTAPTGNNRVCAVDEPLKPGEYLCEFEPRGSFRMAWTINATAISVEIRAGTNGWASLGFGGEMVGSIAQLGWCSDGVANIEEYLLADRATSGINLQEPSPLSDRFCQEEGGTTTIRYIRPLQTESLTISPDGDTNIIYALNGDDSISQHSQTNRGLARVNFATGDASTIDETDYVIAHSACMWVAFAGLMPIGALLARYGKMLPIKTPLWFYAHITVQTLAVIMMIPGFVLALKVDDDGERFEENHGRIGLALFILGGTQFLGGVLRPHKAAEGEFSLIRTIWELGHGPLGLAISIMAFINVFYGLELDDDSKEIWWTLHTAWVIIIGGLAIILEGVKTTLRLRKKPEKKSTQDDVEGQVPGDDRQQAPGRRREEEEKKMDTLGSGGGTTTLTRRGAGAAGAASPLPRDGSGGTTNATMERVLGRTAPDSAQVQQADGATV